MSALPSHKSDAGRLSRELLAPEVPTGLVLAGMGGPDGPDSVEPFLRNLFRDPAVLPLPAPLARMLGWLIVRRRLEKVRRRYEEIGHGGGSPQLDWTLRQGEALARAMCGKGLEVIAAPAMRYWHPFPDETVNDLHRRGARQFLVVPAYPQFSSATSGSVLSAVRDAVGRKSPDLPVHLVAEWHLLPGYVDALVRRAEPALKRWAEEDRDPAQCALLCVAHSLPERFLKNGDPYLSQTRATVAAVNEGLAKGFAGLGPWWRRLPGGGRPLLAFQSKVGPVRWIGPEVGSEMERLARAGCRRLMLLPVSFTCEHIETLHELDIELASEARAMGIEEFIRGEALNLDPGWLDSLARHLAETAFACRRRSSPGREEEKTNA